MAVTTWVRFHHQGRDGFGTLAGGNIDIHDGDLFDAPKSTGKTLALSDVQLLAPARPTKIVALWNNFHALAAKLNVAEPPEPLYFLKATSSVTAPGAVVTKPASYSGKVIYEGELGVVIGKKCSAVSVDKIDPFILGYTCVNDITAVDILKKDPTFDQWARAKSFDSFCPFGPGIVSGIDPAKLVVRTILNGAERQSYPVSDMIFSPQQIVSLVSHDMTLLPGDLICCGTSLGAGTMKDPVNHVTVAIDGVGELVNEYRN
jgi:2-keto-4-pentenoate hydratase/2-oxohepta-3-ene-1,7-dioic acid hydratase in catechol pathway